MKYIQDPIHGAISIEQKILNVIDHKAFQRLRKIKALGFLEMVFPSARHSRFEHSIGAMHVLEKLVLEGIENSKCILLQAPNKSDYQELSSLDLEKIKEEKNYYLLAALLHDVGHGPFSHASETLMPTVASLLQANSDEPEFVRDLIRKLYKDLTKKADHETYTILIISKILRESDYTEDEVKKVLAFKTGIFEHVPGMESLVKLIHPLIDGEFDCDRMDYLVRDSYFCGVSYGKFDFERITKGICFLKTEKAFHICFKRKSLSALEDFIFSRFQMHSQIYTHRIDVSCNQSFMMIAENSGYVLPSEIELYINFNDTNLIEASEGKLSKFSAVVDDRKLWPIVFESFNVDLGNESVIITYIESCLKNTEYSIKRTDKPFKKPGLLNLPMIVENIFGKQSVTQISTVSQLLAHYNGSFNATRMFVHPDKYEEVQKALGLLQDKKKAVAQTLINNTQKYKQLSRERLKVRKHVIAK